MRLGIDFGTTRTVVAAATRGRYPVAVFETSAGYADFVPGLAAGSDSALSFGWDAAAQLSATPCALRSIKRVVSRLAPDAVIEQLPNCPSALELTTRYLQALRQSIVQTSNLGADASERFETMVAVPASAGPRQRYLTLEAFKRAGFEVLGMLNEPTAAAIEYAHRVLGAVSTKSPKRYVVIYDLGGGTFDTSAISLADRRYELLTSEGIADLGGDDFDEAILELALEAFGRQRAELDLSTRARALELCREAKEGLGSASKKLLVELGDAIPGLTSVTLDTRALYERVEPLVKRTRQLVDEVFQGLARHGIDPNNPRELGALYLVGGASAFPLVGRVLRETYGRKVQLSVEPHAATAIGLAIAADPGAEIYVREAVTRHFGVWREADGGRDKVFDRIFSKDARSENGEHVVERRYSPVHPVGHLRFLECSGLGASEEPAGDVTPWGDLFVPYLPELADHPDLPELAEGRRLAEGSEHVVERYAYGRDGSVRVAIENTTRGYRHEFVLGEPRWQRRVKNGSTR